MNASPALLLALLLQSGAVAAQSREDFGGIVLESDARGRAVALTFEDDPTGCSGVAEQTGVLASAEWDVVVTAFTLRVGRGQSEFYVPGAIYNVPNAYRGALSDLFAEGRRLRVAFRECGSGGIPNFVSVRTATSR